MCNSPPVAQLWRSYSSKRIVTHSRLTPSETTVASVIAYAAARFVSIERPLPIRTVRLVTEVVCYRKRARFDHIRLRAGVPFLSSAVASIVSDQTEIRSSIMARRRLSVPQSSTKHPDSRRVSAGLVSLESRLIHIVSAHSRWLRVAWLDLKRAPRFCRRASRMVYRPRHRDCCFASGCSAPLFGYRPD